jgi:hypothetical protein
MCGGVGHRSYRRLATLPIDPSPTPWDFNTWGFFCDNCMTFFDLLQHGKVLTFMDEDGECWASYEHKCGQPARYIGYCRDEAQA